MKKHSVVLVMIAMLAALCIPAAFAQATGTVKGVAKDMQGNPIAGATVEWYNTDNGRKYTLKTNKKGEYFSLGIEPGKYKVTLLQDGKQLDSVNGYGVKVDENTLDFDEKQSQTEAAKQKGISQEQLKQMQEAQEKQAKEVTTVKAYDHAAQLYPAGAAQFYYNQGAVLTNAGKADQAIASFDKAIAADPNKAEAYYQKGVNLIAKETTDKNGKVIPAPGTEAALNKYLELQPNGPFAEAAKGLLQSIGATVETSYGKKKPSKK